MQELTLNEMLIVNGGVDISNTEVVMVMTVLGGVVGGYMAATAGSITNEFLIMLGCSSGCGIGLAFGVVVCASLGLIEFALDEADIYL